MSHPKETMKKGGKLWHLEDTVSNADAGGLVRHLRKTEEKLAFSSPISKTRRKVWWASK